MALCMEKKEFKIADILFNNLADAPLDHHARAIVDSIPRGLMAGLNSVGDYMD